MRCYSCLEDYRLEDYIDCDSTDKGYWCDICDTFNPYDPYDFSQINIILETEKHKEEKVKKKTNFKKRLSPLRYPGGKSRMIDFLSSFIRKNKSSVLLSPFSGGASFELSVLEAGVVDKLILNDLDKGVYSFWRTVISDPSELIKDIRKSTPTKEDFYKYRKILKEERFEKYNVNEIAYMFFVVNRLSYSGISYANPMTDHLARWNPDNLIDRIEFVYDLSDKIEVLNLDFSDFLMEFGGMEGTFFIDPPYVEKGNDLYLKGMTLEMHDQLSHEVSESVRFYGTSDFVITYDNHPLLKELYNQDLFYKIARRYSI